MDLSLLEWLLLDQWIFSPEEVYEVGVDKYGMPFQEN